MGDFTYNGVQKKDEKPPRKKFRLRDVLGVAIKLAAFLAKLLVLAFT